MAKLPSTSQYKVRQDLKIGGLSILSLSWIDSDMQFGLTRMVISI